MAETDYLEAILNANVYDVAIETPLQQAPLLSERLGVRAAELSIVSGHSARDKVVELHGLSAVEAASRMEG